jgi:hypothetical protein
MFHAATCLRLLSALVLVANDNLQAFEASKTTRLRRKSAEIWNNADVADQVETILKRNECPRINEEMSSTAIFAHPSYPNFLKMP